MGDDDTSQPGRGLTGFLNSPANWTGLGLASAAVAAPLLGWLPAAWWLAPAGYGLGFVAAGWCFGFPRAASGDWQALESAPADQPDAAALRAAVERIASVATDNPGQRLSPPLQSRVLLLCDQLRELCTQLERSDRALAPEDAFHARQLVLAYLPQALRTYTALDPHAARTQRLDNGRTAQETLAATLDDLSAKAGELAAALRAGDTEAFVNHARFLQEKFGSRKT